MLEAYKVLSSLNQKVAIFVGGGHKAGGLSRSQIQKYRENTKYKHSTGRNVLGVRILLEDWIHGLEIGHVMQLNPMLASELQNP